MVSKASEDLPEPERPVMTTSLSRGIETETFLRLCSRAPVTTIWSWGTDTSRISGSSPCGSSRGSAGGRFWLGENEREQLYDSARDALNRAALGISVDPAACGSCR